MQIHSYPVAHDIRLTGPLRSPLADLSARRTIHRFHGFLIYFSLLQHRIWAPRSSKPRKPTKSFTRFGGMLPSSTDLCRCSCASAYHTLTILRAVSLYRYSYLFGSETQYCLRYPIPPEAWSGVLCIGCLPPPPRILFYSVLPIQKLRYWAKIRMHCSFQNCIDLADQFFSFCLQLVVI